MTDRVARCLYRISRAPISATISMTDSSSEQKIATTNVSDTTGWLHVGAYGFTFSDPTIQVHPTGKIATAPKPLRVTFGCVSRRDARVKRRVTRVLPRCPRGFRHVKSVEG